MDTTTHISINPSVCGGKPCIGGTRIRVWDVHVWHNLRGQSPEEIVAGFPQLSLADVHAALAYYFDHREDIQHQMRESEKFVEAMRREQEPTKFELLKQALGLNDSISSR